MYDRIDDGSLCKVGTTDFQPTIVTDIVNNCDDFNNIVKSTEVKAQSSTSAKSINEDDTCISLFVLSTLYGFIGDSFKTMYDRIDDGSLCKVGTHVSNLEPPTFKMMRDFWHSAMVFNCNNQLSHLHCLLEKRIVDILQGHLQD
jgi:hypothetical protein